MNIVLKGADFSANNIGHVDLPIVYNQMTLDYLAAIPTRGATMTYNELRGLNNFFDGLSENGLLSKIDKCFIPAFGATEGAVNLVAPASAPLNLPVASSNVVYSSNGIRMLNGSFFTSNFSQTYNLFHAGFANKTPIAGTISVVSGAINSSASSYSFTIGRKPSASMDASGVLISSTDRIHIPNHVNSSGVVIVGNDASNWQAYVDGEYGVDNRQNSIITTNPTIGGNNANPDCFHPIWFLTFGKSSMTQTQISIYGSLIQNLMDVF